MRRLQTLPSYIVVADMARALNFYRALGLNAPTNRDDDVQVQIATPGCPTIGLVTEAFVRNTNPTWVTPVGQRVTFSCRCDSPAAVDTTYGRMTKAGYTGLKEPWDAFWGKRYCFCKIQTAIASICLRRSQRPAGNDLGKH
jgi:predicted lactoylglutathione lyase